MLKLGRVTKVKVFFLVLVFAFNFDLLNFSAAILGKGLLDRNDYLLWPQFQASCSPMPRIPV